MNEKRFELSEYSTVYRYSVIDNIQKGTLKANEIIILLSKQAKKIDEQQATIRKLQDLCGESDSENAKLRQEIKELKAQLREKEQDEQLYANEILELRETNKEFIQFKELGGDY